MKRRSFLALLGLGPVSLPAVAALDLHTPATRAHHYVVDANGRLTTKQIDELMRDLMANIAQSKGRFIVDG